MAAGSANDDLIAVFVPFQDRAWPHTEPLPDLRWNRDLSLRGDFRLRQCHSSYYHGNVKGISVLGVGGYCRASGNAA